MATRKIKDAKDLTTNELIYFKGHAQATYMSDGRTVEEAISEMSGGSDEDSDIFILDLFGIAGYSDDPTNTGVIEFGGFPAEFMSMIDSAIQKNKLVIRVDYIDLYNLEIDAYNSTNYLIIKSQFEWGGQFSQLHMVINPGALSGTFSISPVNNVSGINSITINGVDKTPSTSGVVDLGYINKRLSTSTSSSMTLSPNIYYRNTNTSLSSLTITFSGASNSNILNEYFIEFTTASSGTTIGLPMNIKWANGVTPTFENGTTYLLSFVNNLGVCTKFSL